MRQQQKNAIYQPDPLPYKRAPRGSPDKFVTTAPVKFFWSNVRASLVGDLPTGSIRVGAPSNPGHLRHHHANGVHHLSLAIPSPYYFAVSVAPSFRRALPGALPHDYIYERVEEIAAGLNISVRETLHIADRWFFAQLSASGFLFRRTYYVGVRLFGYYFHQLFN